MDSSLKAMVGILILVLGVLIGHSFWPRIQTITGAYNAVGTTFSTARVAQVNMTPATDAASSTAALLNTDSTDRIIMDSFASCNTVGTSKTDLIGTGLAAWTLNFATSSSAAQVGNTNYAANLTIGTSSTNVYVASSTEPVLNAFGRIWASGVYLIPTFNATNTAACTVGVHYLAS